MHKILDWKGSDDTRDIVHIVVQALVEGRRVVVPAETAYHLVASGLNPQIASYFEQLQAAGHIGRVTLFLRSDQELLDYVTNLSPIAARIAHRAWPGPLILELPMGDGRSLLSKLPIENQKLILSENRVTFRVASHRLIHQALRLMSGPLVAASIQRNSKPVQNADQAGDLTGATIVVDDGQTPLDELATVVRVDGNRCQVVQPGALNGESLYRNAQFVILLVCTGNTCRSPMAEAMLKDKFAHRFPNDISGASPVYVASGGISAYPGGPASIEAQNVMAARGLSLSQHQSRAITKHALQIADLILVMTRGHRDALLDNMPEIKSKVHLLSGSSADVSDPFGGPESHYATCAEQIDGFLDDWIQKLPDCNFPVWV